MGTFEKLGVLVIVVIIVMILAVAIYQWGGPAVADTDGAGLDEGLAAPELTIRTLEDLEQLKERERPPAPGPEPDAEAWPGGIPREYVVKANDKIWKVVVDLWKLSPAFVDAITRANPDVRMDRLKPGQRLSVPDPAPFRPGAEAPEADGVRTYEIQVGDSLETIARTHLGKKSRWPEILKLNSGLKPKRLKPGQVIRIPAK